MLRRTLRLGMLVVLAVVLFVTAYLSVLYVLGVPDERPAVHPIHRMSRYR
jgi:hypothetical protein